MDLEPKDFATEDRCTEERARAVKGMGTAFRDGAMKEFEVMVDGRVYSHCL